MLESDVPADQGYLFPGMDKDSSKKKIVWPGQEPSKEVGKAVTVPSC